ncbi:TVP38/TMEM64 family protein [bacterium]|nr:TVP38/TMEM64 family protein [bacterium]
MRRVSKTLKTHWRQIIVLLLLAGSILLFRILGWDEYLDFASVSERRLALRRYVEAHYWVAVATFIGIYMTTALFVPGAIVLTLVGGFLFGVPLAALYINVGATLGAVLALLVSRHLAGSWVQERYAEQLVSLNRAIERHGVSYLMALRILPIFPFFAVNYLAGLTRIPLKTFIWTTSLGMLPGSLIYAYAGLQLGSISRPEDIISVKILTTLALLTFFTLLPPIFDVLLRWRNRT